MRSSASTMWYVGCDEPAASLRECPSPDAAAARALVERLYPRQTLRRIDDAPLAEVAHPPESHVYVGVFPDLAVVCTPDLCVGAPSTIPAAWTKATDWAHAYLVGIQSPWSWGCFAHWENGNLRRAFSAGAADIHEDTGLPMPFECDYWAGVHPQFGRGEPAPFGSLPFSPVDFADAANEEWLGFRHNPVDDGPSEHGDLVLTGFRLGEDDAPAQGRIFAGERHRHRPLSRLLHRHPH